MQKLPVIVAIQAVVLGFALPRVSATDFVWTGAGDGTSWDHAMNWRTAEGTVSEFPKGSGDTVRFPDLGFHQKVTLRDTKSFIVGKTTFENSADYEFVNPDGKTAADITFMPDSSDFGLTFGTNATIVLNGVSWSTGKKENFAPATLVLKNGAIFEIGSTFYDEFGGTISVESGSTFRLSGRPINLAANEKGEGGLIVVSNATLHVAGINFTTTNRPGGRILLRGERPRLFLAYRNGSTTEEGAIKDNNGDGKIVFDIPLWGYDQWVPFLSADTHGTSLSGGQNSPSLTISPDSAVFRADFNGVLPLVSTPIVAARMSSRIFPKLEEPVLACGQHFGWRFSGAAMPGDNAVDSTGTVSDYAWSEMPDGSAPTTFLGVYLKVQYGTLFLFR